VPRAFVPGRGANRLAVRLATAEYETTILYSAGSYECLVGMLLATQGGWPLSWSFSP
jgi:hypothetical protein